ncbi:IS701 family transposase [Streptomyces katsurahamanus]|uniref:Transposase n=1 Tax=Streptomyces katsurahamanus TaxID=2577098 RepID=A0ABW9P0W3_9ACTN|nr:transposase [Streptomyces katsurahamanus]MQS39216.1 transposase [Streptomyces katsurahamanus]
MTTTPRYPTLNRPHGAPAARPVQSWPAGRGAGIRDSTVRELCDSVFDSLTRRDQRRKAEVYLRGLLCAPGRKSMRNIAARTGDRNAEQSLQHFISCSTWEWAPVRAAHARHLEQLLRPVAWVVRPMTIPKAGRHSVGVEPRYVPRLGQLVNSQQAYGVWLAAPDASSPAAWRLQISARWLEDGERRRRADIPEGLTATTPEQCAGDAVADLARFPGLRRRPVVLDLGEPGTGEAYRRVQAAGLPALARIRGDMPVIAESALLTGYADGPASARRVAEAARTLQRPVDWFDPASGIVRTSLVAAVPVLSLPPRPSGTGHRAAARPATLLAEWPADRPGPAACWITDLVGLHAPALLRMTKLVRQVDHGFAAISDRVGIRDFEGRSFQGWHRHTTLASVAHTARLTETHGLLSQDLTSAYGS